MRELDETDMIILELLADDGRRPYSEIGDIVDLTPPAVSDRVSRLQDAGVIEQFTIDVNRSTLRGGTPVLVRVEPTQGTLDDVRSGLADAEATEHLFTTADGSIVAFARTTTEAVHEWVADTVGSEAVADVDVDLVADSEWTPNVDAAGFQLDCAECGNTVTSEGTSVTIDDDQKHFCCESCETAYVEQYREMEEAADAE
jgi:Lrp/AsnC family leucine-responsive transcriptional regulator